MTKLRPDVWTQRELSLLDLKNGFISSSLTVL